MSPKAPIQRRRSVTFRTEVLSEKRFFEKFKEFSLKAKEASRTHPSSLAAARGARGLQSMRPTVRATRRQEETRCLLCWRSRNSSAPLRGPIERRPVGAVPPAVPRRAVPSPRQACAHHRACAGEAQKPANFKISKFRKYAAFLKTDHKNGKSSCYWRRIWE